METVVYTVIVLGVSCTGAGQAEHRGGPHPAPRSVYACHLSCYPEYDVIPRAAETLQHEDIFFFVPIYADLKFGKGSFKSLMFSKDVSKIMHAPPNLSAHFSRLSTK